MIDQDFLGLLVCPSSRQPLREATAAELAHYGSVSRVVPLDELRDASRGGKDWIARLQEDERKRTGIDSLKIKFNNVFGYFIEVTTSHLAKVPDDYTRKQTMSNAERYITPALKEMENKVLGAEERSKKLEAELFADLRTQEIDIGIAKRRLQRKVRHHRTDHGATQATGGLFSERQDI